MGNLDILKDFGIPVNPHLDQLNRIRRWKRRLDEIRFSNSSEDRIPHQIDFIYAFFTNCYHLRDFLNNSKKNSDIVISDNVINQLNQFFKTNIEMQICRDICNESKHCSLEYPAIGVKIPNTNKKSAEGLAGVCIVKEYDPFQEVLKNTNPIKNIKYVVLAEGKKYDVFELADKCLKLWEDFFQENDLADK